MTAAQLTVRPKCPHLVLKGLAEFFPGLQRRGIREADLILLTTR